MKHLLISFIIGFGLMAATITNCFAAVSPIKGVGVVIKKNPGGSSEKAITDKEGSFALQLEAGEYLVTLDPKQLQMATERLLKENNLAVNNPFGRDGRVELSIFGKCCPTRVIAMTDQDYTYAITIPQGGENIQGKLNFNLGSGKMSAETIGGTLKTRPNCPPGYTMVSGQCIPTIIIDAPWLSMKTGLIKYFEYKQDFVITDPTLCKALGVNQLVIAKGKYEVDYNSPNMGGKIRLPWIIPIKLPNGRPPIINKVYEGTYPKGQDCKSFGNACFFTTEPTEKADLQLFSITPVVENGACIAIEIQYRGTGSPKQAGF